MSWIFKKQSPTKQSFCQSLRRDTHWKCLILTVLINGCLAAIIWCRFTTIEHVMPQAYQDLPFYTLTDRSSPCEDGYVYIPVAFVVMLYLVYLVECWHCHTRIQLQSKVDVNTVYDRVQGMKESLPIVWWKATCYHYVRRTRQVTRYRNGDAFTTTQVYYERVNSHAASSAFNFTNCGVKDVSKELINLENYPATKIRFSKGFSFTVLDAEHEYEEQRAEFFQEHERRDDYMETREGLDMMNINFKEYMIAFADPDHLPWYISQVVFWVGSLMLLSWPLRVLIEYKTAYVHYHVHKLFGTNYMDNASTTQAHISRVSTMASVDLEMTIQNNYSMVPSYSEALLMDGTNPAQVIVRDANGNITPGHTLPNGYTPIPGNMYTKLYRGSGSSGHLNSSANGITHSVTPLTRGRSVILRIPQSVNNRLRRKRKQRRHSLAEVVPLNEFLPQSLSSSTSAVSQCPRSVSMLAARAGLEAGLSTGLTQGLAKSEPFMNPESIMSRESVNDVIVNRQTDTILEVDSEQNSPLPGRSISSGQTSPPESSGSNTPLLGHRSPARHRNLSDNSHGSPIRNRVRLDSSSSNNSSAVSIPLIHNALCRHRSSLDSNSSTTPLIHNSPVRHHSSNAYNNDDTSSRTSTNIVHIDSARPRFIVGSSNQNLNKINNVGANSFIISPESDQQASEVLIIPRPEYVRRNSGGSHASSISPIVRYCPIHAPPDSPPSYEDALGMQVAQRGQSELDSAVRLMETAL